MDRVVVSVRTIAEFSMESGDLYPNMDAYERMQDGAQAHKRLQMAYGEGAKAEVAVALDAEVEGVPMRVQGRIDGAAPGGNGAYTVQEIKSTRHNPRYIRENGQSRTLGAGGNLRLSVRASKQSRAHFGDAHLCEQRGWRSLVYARTYAGRAGRNLSFPCGQVCPLVARHWRLARELSRKRARRAVPARKLPQRPAQNGQKRLYRHSRPEIAPLPAPTGTGKTLGALFPAVKAISEGLIARAFLPHGPHHRPPRGGGRVAPFAAKRAETCAR